MTGEAVTLPEDEGALVSAYYIDAEGNSRPLKPDEVRTIPTGDDWIWLHFHVDDPETRTWLEKDESLDEAVVDSLASTGTRPRYQRMANGELLILRGVNLNPGQDPEDMVSIRMWIEKNRVITSRRQKVLAIFALRDAYEHGKGPKTPVDFLIELGNGLVDRMRSTITALDDTTQELQELSAGEDAKISEHRGEILQMRSRTIMLRRYLNPQRDALTDYMSENSAGLPEHQRNAMRMVTDKISRYVEDLDAIRDRSAAVQEELSARLAEQMNTTMFRLAVVATIFLPLSLLTGLLGINVGGMPGVDDNAAFWWVTISLIAMGIGLVWLMKRWKMI